MTDAINSGSSIEIKTMTSKVGELVSKSICPNPIGIVGGGVNDYTSYVSILTYAMNSNSWIICGSNAQLPVTIYYI